MYFSEDCSIEQAKRRDADKKDQSLKQNKFTKLKMELK